MTTALKTFRSSQIALSAYLMSHGHPMLGNTVEDGTVILMFHDDDALQSTILRFRNNGVCAIGDYLRAANDIKQIIRDAGLNTRR